MKTNTMIWNTMRMENESHYYGIYIHIPFCERKCYYCDFLSAPSTEERKEEYVQALIKEIEAKGSFISKEYVVRTIFFGGGTPSLLTGEQVERILSCLKKVTTWNETVEITMECNPGTVTKETLVCYRNAGVNRISFGLQSTNNEMLKRLGRIHTYEQFLESYRLAREVGFSNINIDLMSGLPRETKEDWKKDITTIMKLTPPPEHISAYRLIIEEGTPFYYQYSSGKELPEEEEERQMYEMTKELLETGGYSQYEISNYAKSGFECLHNLFYWTLVSYVGFGIGASSYFENHRFSNTSDMDTYLDIWKDFEKGKQLCFSYQDKKSDFKDETISLEEDVVEVDNISAMEEFMFLGLRLIQGVSKEEFYKRFQIRIEDVYQDVIQDFIKKGFLIETSHRIYLTKEGISISNYVLSNFLIDRNND